MSRPRVISLNRIRHALLGYQEMAKRLNDATALESARQGLAELEETERVVTQEHNPKIVCLCGSTRFKETFEKENARLTLEGFIVLSVGCFYKEYEWDGEETRLHVKIDLDDLHKRKIDLADWIFVLNVNGYIGESTSSEIAYAEAHGKPVRYLEALREDKP